jgi:hypothetical protein
MNRCNALFRQAPLGRTLLLNVLGGALFMLWSWAAAQGTVRPFPADTERGLMVVTYPPIVQMNGKPDRLSPGSRIRGQNNMLILSGTIVGQPLLVNFVRTPTGEVHDVWVLTDAEASLRLPTQQ